MNTIVLFLTLLILVSSCTSIVMKSSNSKERTYPVTPALNPLTGQHSLRQRQLIFCDECANACFRRKKPVRSCQRFICRCAIRDVGY
ncbi:Defensin-like (DEFL) family protein [Arabidopsis thaliana]|uniref:Putative defensin-like protein 211 n=1 Tax=Arabidopsis thaliana TaxID=3702 RepID=DF211_ARATH|nr:Defensin-like (DEFL) family protein [Arabidopsis thaliana]Q2V3K7.1 RecName: Full=Putative defensin-like protein 211; Flags: Precursor [Arabidopsis thaliana]AEE82650.1 Defensin-like (DEFL) family protein [Arabidopsis thaliana]|eukprot:NP_001031595.1 Defensin-like (DEFL) family protein [Arabidopsis thaliana]